jgi:geranylgeranyl transferase type-1 subunit beta
MNELGKLKNDEKEKIIDWIYRLQLTSKHGKNLEYTIIRVDFIDVPPEHYGFRGSSLSKHENGKELISEYESAHIAQTYSALCCLLLLGDDLKRVDRKAILTALKLSQQKDGR